MAESAPYFDSKDHQFAALCLEKLWVGAFLERLASVRAAPAKLPCLRRGWLEAVKGETKMVSTTSWAP